MELLVSIQKLSFFKNVRLVGGTALALQLGHRVSIDLDFFGTIIPDSLEITLALQKVSNPILQYSTPNIFSFLVNEVKVDIVNYPYPWLTNPIEVEGVVMASMKDIAAMKLSAISGRGSKKDFIDLFYLLNQFSLEEMISFYNNKYKDGNAFLVLRSLTYFDDADKGEVNMIEDINWTDIKKFITQIVNQYLDRIQ